MGDKKWKKVLSRALFHTWMLPLYILVSVFAALIVLLKYGLKSDFKQTATAPAEPVRDQSVDIEVHFRGSSSWQKVMQVASTPDAIESAFNTVAQGASASKVRAIGSQTRQVYDIR